MKHRATILEKYDGYLSDYLLNFEMPEGVNKSLLYIYYRYWAFFPLTTEYGKHYSLVSKVNRWFYGHERFGFHFSERKILILKRFIKVADKVFYKEEIFWAKCLLNLSSFGLKTVKLTWQAKR